MKIGLLIAFFAAIVSLGLTSCSDGYDAGECERLADMIVRDRALTQDDYAAMIEQYESILKYLIRRADEVLDESDPGRREQLVADLRSDDEYLQRFSYMFTFGSTLYRAEESDSFDQENRSRYEALDEYVEEFAKRTEQI